MHRNIRQPRLEKKRSAEIVASQSRLLIAPSDGCEQPHRDESEQGPQPSGKSRSTVRRQPKVIRERKKEHQIVCSVK